KSKSKIRSDRILQKARDFLDKGKNEKAIEAVDQILTGEVHDEDLMTFLIASRISAFASVNLKNYDKAAETALQALKFRDDIPDFFYILTLSYAGMEELDQAEEYAGKFLALVSRQQHECNIPDMLAETRSKTYLVYNLLGTALREQERYEEAGQAFEKSYNDNPEYAAAYINHAKLLHGLGDDDGACRVFNLALQN
ncbi:MAG: hypothetical protein GWN00_19690, partial [Aliifodinibius sp.]|nr:tetratricopeptide repeat protein [candidate division Zixibacteria bacterium]NIT58362.1 tetratricopeptide repeat protein [Fodinibius sp.]NIW42402.1 hypothetical protein [candidate division Zixibacteria bacterium]NIX57167.1 hypothetical protein [candidate division Zixibacteria bacterium]NIY26945.1 hypothetical protein [Fodinibius sp.]